MSETSHPSTDRKQTCNGSAGDYILDGSKGTGLMVKVGCPGYLMLTHSLYLIRNTYEKG